MKKITLLLLLLCITLPSPATAARVWSSGAELQSATAAMEFEFITGSPAIDTSTKRSGAASLRINPTAATNYAGHEYSASGTGISYARAYIYIATAPAGLTNIMKLADSTVAGDGVSVRLNSNRTLEFWDDFAGAQIGSDSSALSLNQWYRIELSGGANTDPVSARIDGTQFASASSRGGTATAAQRFYFGALSSATMDMYIDDIAVNDTSGSVQTSWPGEGNIVHMQPDSAGDLDQSVQSPNGWQAVDEVTPDDATTIAVLDADFDDLYANLESASSAGIDSYDSVTLVQVGERSNAVSASSMTWNVGIMSQSSGTELKGPNTSHNDTTYRTNGDTTAPQVYTLTSYVDPQAGGAWTPALLDTTQIIGTAFDAAPDVNLTALWALVEYVDGAAPSPVTAAPIYLGSGKLILTNGKMVIY